MSERRSWTDRMFLLLLAAAGLSVAIIVGGGFLYAGRTIFGLLMENMKLKQAISNLTAESQIGYAKVISQTERNGQVTTRLLFVETERDDPTKHVLEKEYEIAGDVIYFDALIVKFGNEYVSDGRERALYLWRRVYGEQTAPGEGCAIEEKGAEPKRYAELFRKLSLRDRKLFWAEIWKLSDDPGRLSKAGIQAIYGNAVYKKLRPGLIYIFKISNTGQLYPETVPAL